MDWDFNFLAVDPDMSRLVLDGDVWCFDFRVIDEELRNGVQHIAPGYEVKICFYTMVIPLTLLSAYLLLSKPRKKPN